VVRQSLAQLKVTRVVITQRLPTVMNADRIDVLEAGHVVETGNYQTLMAANGVFATLASRQLA
jgi:ABC-type multidrug transport system fused ATPase/permease subunit